MKPGSQADTILRFIKRYGSITPRDAVTFGCYRLAARIYDLKQAGYDFEVDESEGFARYRLRHDPTLEALGQGTLW